MPRWNTRGAITRVWLMRGVGAVGVILLATVPALGLTMLSPGLFPTRRASEKVSSPETDDAVSYNPLTFDAPTTTLQSMIASEPGSRPQALGVRAPLLPLNRLPASPPQVSGGKGPKAAEIASPDPGFNLGPSLPNSQPYSVPVGPNAVSSPRMTGEKILSSGQNRSSFGGSPVFGGSTQRTTNSGGGQFQTPIFGGSSQRTTNSGGGQFQTTRTTSSTPLQFASVNQPTSLNDRQMRTQRPSAGAQLQGLDEPLQPLDSDLSKRKPRKHRHSPHH